MPILPPALQNSPHSTSSRGLSADVRRAQSGDTKAFEQLYREHVGRVYAVCLRMMADSTKAEELTQDVFVRAWQVLPSFRGDAAFSSWLHRVAVNVVLVYLRTERRRESRVSTVEDLETLEQANLGNPTGEKIDLERAIAQLPSQARTIFVLHDIEGFKHEEIAEQLGLATGTCKAQLHRARKILSQKLM